MDPITFLLCAAVVLIVLIAFVVSERRRKLSFEKRFPPISDAEFMARCAPGTNPDVALRVRRIVAEQMGIDYERVHPESRFIDDLGA